MTSLVALSFYGASKIKFHWVERYDKLLVGSVLCLVGILTYIFHDHEGEGYSGVEHVHNRKLIGLWGCSELSNLLREIFSCQGWEVNLNWHLYLLVLMLVSCWLMTLRTKGRRRREFSLCDNRYIGFFSQALNTWNMKLWECVVKGFPPFHFVLFFGTSICHIGLVKFTLCRTEIGKHCARLSSSILRTCWGLAGRACSTIMPSFSNLWCFLLQVLLMITEMNCWIRFCRS